MSTITLVLELGTPEIGKTKRKLSGGSEKQEKCSIEEQVAEMIKLVESDRDSHVEWKALKSLYSDLMQIKQTPRVKALRRTIKPVLSKYGYHVE